MVATSASLFACDNDGPLPEEAGLEALARTTKTAPPIGGHVSWEGDLLACTSVGLSYDPLPDNFGVPADGIGSSRKPCEELELNQSARFGQYVTEFPSAYVSGEYERKSAEADVGFVWVGGAQTTNKSAHVGMQAVGSLAATADLTDMEGCCDSYPIHLGCWAGSGASFKQDDLTFEAQLDVVQGGNAVFEPYIVESSILNDCEESVRVVYEVLGTSISGVLTESNTANPTSVHLTPGTYTVRLTLEHSYALEVWANQGVDTCLEQSQCNINVAIGANLTLVP